MPTAVPQVNVIISFTIDNNVVYSYTRPDGQKFTNSATCDLVIKQPTNCLFVLDYAATLAGWTIVGIAANPAGTAVLDATPGPGSLSLMTTDLYIDHTHTYNYFINYHNTVTNQNCRHDPQEGNEPP